MILQGIEGIEGIEGVGVLVVGTLPMILLNFGITEIMGFLLPTSIKINLFLAGLTYWGKCETC